MLASEIFSICNLVILFGWLLLLMLPKWKYTQAIILNGLLVVFAIVYTFLLFQDIGKISLDSFSTLAKLKLLFQSDTCNINKFNAFMILIFNILLWQLLLQE